MLRVDPGRSHALTLQLHLFHLGVELAPALVVDQTQFTTDGGQTDIGVIFPQQQAIFGAAGEHAIGFAGAQGGEIVHHHAHVGLIPARMPGILVLGTQGGVQTGHQALGCRLFVTGSPVDLAGEEQVGDAFALHVRLEIPRIEEIVLDGIAGASDVGILEAPDRTDDLHLHVEWQAGGDPVRIEFMGSQTFRLDENLVRGLVSEPGDLVLNGGTVTGAYPFDHSGVHGAAIQIVADHVVGTLVGVGDVAGDLARMLAGISDEGEHRTRIVTVLRLHHGKIDAASIDARRGAGLEAIDAQRHFTQALGQCDRGRIPGATALVVFHPDVDQTVQEGTDGQYHRLATDADPALGHHTCDAIPVHDQIVTGLLEDLQVGVVLQHLAHDRLVEQTIRLGARGAYRRALGRVEGAELDPAKIDGTRHDPAECVNFLDQVSLADPADRRIAGHVPQRIDIVGEQQGIHAHAGCRCCCFCSGMTATDDDHIKLFMVLHWGSPWSARLKIFLCLGWRADHSICLASWGERLLNVQYGSGICLLDLKDL